MHLRSVAFLCGLALVGSPQYLSAHSEPVSEGTLPFARCFAPDTPQEVVDHYAGLTTLGNLEHSLL